MYSTKNHISHKDGCLNSTKENTLRKNTGNFLSKAESGITHQIQLDMAKWLIPTVARTLAFVRSPYANKFLQKR